MKKEKEQKVDDSFKNGVEAAIIGVSFLIGIMDGFSMEGYGELLKKKEILSLLNDLRKEVKNGGLK